MAERMTIDKRAPNRRFIAVRWASRLCASLSGRDIAFVAGVALLFQFGLMAWPPLAPGIPGAVLVFISLRKR